MTSSVKSLPLVVCGECGAPMVLRETTKYPNKDGSPKKFWGCSTFPACRGVHGAHQDSGKPLGVPGDGPTKAARIRAHAAFDTLWKGGAMSRTRAYEWMRTVMELEKREAHIGKFTAAQCERLLERLAARGVT